MADCEGLGTYSFFLADFLFSSLTSWLASRSFTSRSERLAGIISSSRSLLSYKKSDSTYFKFIVILLLYKMQHAHKIKWIRKDKSSITVPCQKERNSKRFQRTRVRRKKVRQWEKNLKRNTNYEIYYSLHCYSYLGISIDDKHLNFTLLLHI